MRTRFRLRASHGAIGVEGNSMALNNVSGVGKQTSLPKPLMVIVTALAVMMAAIFGWNQVPRANAEQVGGLRDRCAYDHG